MRRGGGAVGLQLQPGPLRPLLLQRVRGERQQVPQPGGLQVLPPPLVPDLTALLQAGVSDQSGSQHSGTGARGERKQRNIKYEFFMVAAHIMNMN